MLSSSATENIGANLEEKHLSDINKELYKRNLELAVKNKTLSLLRELYQISILTLEPKDLAAKVVQTIQQALGFELTGIFIYSKDEDCLEPLAFAQSQNFNVARISLHLSIEGVKIIQISNKSFFEPVVHGGKTGYAGQLTDIWDATIPKNDLNALQSQANIMTSIAYPLSIGERVLGIIVLCMNRSYDSLNEFEKESINSFINVISVALDKALLYEQIKVANKKLKELDRQKTEFVSIASHQLRAPLTAIKGYSSMLLEGSYGELAEKSRLPIDNIFESSNRLVAIIEDFLNITRIELGKMKYEYSDFNIKELVEKIVNELRPTVEKKGLIISFEAAEGDYFFHADEGKIGQVIGNIIDNALKYTPSGSIKVSLSSVDGRIKIIVSDTGVGLEAEDISKLFEKFIRVDGAGNVNYSGTGLGLYVAKQMVEAHKGKIWVESPGKNKGSTFFVELPIKT